MSSQHSSRKPLRTFPLHYMLAFTLLIVSTLSAFSAHAALDVQVNLDAPATLLPGEAGTFSVTASLSNVSIVSFPTNASITYPDGTIVPIELQGNNQGSYEGSLYLVAEGTYTIDVQVILGSETFPAQAIVNVRKPSLNSIITATLANGTIEGTITQAQAASITIELTPFATGDITTKQYTTACTVACALTCSFSCAAPSTPQIVRFSTQSIYEYTSYAVVGEGTPTTEATYDRVTGVGEPELVSLTTPAEVYTIIGTQIAPVSLIGGTYSFTPAQPGNASIIIKEGNALATLPVEIITRNNIITAPMQEASDGTGQWWYGFVQATAPSLLKLPGEPGTREAYLLSNGRRTELTWEKSYVKVPATSGWIEVRRSTPATASTTPIATGYGSLVGGAGIQRHAFAGRASAWDATMQPISTYTDADTTVFYTIDQFAAVVEGTAGTLGISQPLKSNELGTIQFILPDSEDNTNTTGINTIFSVYSWNGTLQLRQTFAGTSGTRDIEFTMPAGSYIAVAEANTRAATPLRIYSDHASISFDEGKTYTAEENTEVTLVHALTNGDLQQPRVIELQASSDEFTVLMNATDSNSNGIPDVTVLPGETALVTATAFVPRGSLSGSVTFTASTDDLNTSVTDTINVIGAVIPIFVDADVVAIQGDEAGPTAIVQNNFNAELTGTLYINGENMSTQRSVTLAPGTNTIRLPQAGHRVTIRLQIANDNIPENNERTREFRTPFSTRLVHINERLHADHGTYTVQLPTIPGVTLVWIGENGEQLEATAQIDGATTLWNMGPVPANYEFTAAFIPGEPERETVAYLLDNSNPSVTKRGTWTPSISVPGYVGYDYFTDLGIDKNSDIVYAPGLSRDIYSIRINTPADPSFDDNVPVTINAKPVTTVLVNQRQGGWQYLGIYEMNEDSNVVLSNRKTTQFVVADAFEFTPVSQIGGLILLGNSSLEQFAVVGQSVSIETAGYIESIAGITAPDNVSVSQSGTRISMYPYDVGTFTIIVSDGERTLTITLSVSDKPPEPVTESRRELVDAITVGEPVEWRVFVPVNETPDTAVIDIPENVLNLSVKAVTTIGVQEVPTDSMVIVEDNSIQPSETVLLENQAGELERQAAIAQVERDSVTLTEVTSELEKAQIRGIEAAASEVIAADIPEPETIKEIFEEAQPIEERNQTPTDDEALPALLHITDLPDETQHVEITYTTEAPELVVEAASDFEQTLTVTSETHYENITAYLDIIPSPVSAIHLVRTTNGSNETVYPEYFDSDGDGLVERIQWLVPHLSNQTYELSINILNPLEYLRDGDTWTVFFQTTGTGNLTIFSPNANWTEVLTDDGSTSDEMTFTAMLCGENDLTSELYVIDANNTPHAYTSLTSEDSFRPVAFTIQNYECNETGSFANLMNIAGYAVLNFTFTNGFLTQSALAVDPTPIDIGFSNPTPPDGAILATASAVVNVSINESKLQGLSYFWTGGNYSIYDNNSVMVLLNLNNVAAIGENTTQVKDVSVNNLTGTIITGAAYNTSGRVGTAVSFNGITGYINMSTDLSTWLGNTATLSAWFMTGATGSASPWLAPGITGVEMGAANDIFWGYITNTGRIAVQAGNTAGAVSTSTVNDNRWHFVTITRNASSGSTSIYINGTLQATAVSEVGAKTTPFYSFGRIEDVTGTPMNWSGSLDEIRVWNRTLSATEISMLYNSTLSKHSANGWDLVANHTGLTAETEYSLESCALNGTVTTCTSRSFAYSTASNQYNARVFVWDTNNTTSRSDDRLMGTISGLQLSPTGNLASIGSLSESLYSYGRYLVEVQVQPELAYQFDGDYHGDTVIYADASFATSNRTTAGEYVVSTTFVPNDVTATEDVFVSTTSNVDYTVDANTGEIGHIMGDPDAVTSVDTVDDLTVYQNPDASKFASAWTTVDADTNIGVQSSDNDMGVADFDLDGDIDLLIANDDDDVRIFDNDGTPFAGTFTEVSVSANVGTQTQDVNSVVAADLNNDGYPDIAAGIQTNDDIYVFSNDQTPMNGGWVQNAVNTSTGGDVNDLATGDVDRDGDVDLVGAIEGANDITWYRNDGTPFAGTWQSMAIDTNTGEEPQVVKVVDLDGDGDLDVVQGDSGNDIDAYCNNGAATFAENSLYAGASGANNDIAIGDLDRDGDPDLVFAVTTANDILYLENDGTPCAGTMTARTVSSDTTSTPWAVSVADIDGDGWLDILAGINDNDVMVFQNDQTPANGAWTAFDLNGNAGGPVLTMRAADLDNDQSSNILDYFTSVSENVEDGGDEFAGWDNLSANTNYSFYFIMTPDYDFAVNSSENLTIVIGNESASEWTRTYERLFGGARIPIKATWNWSVNRAKYVTIAQMNVSNSTPNLGTTVLVSCQSVDNFTGIGKYENYNYTIRFYVNGVLNLTNSTNSAGWATFNYSPPNNQTATLTCDPENRDYFDFTAANGNKSLTVTAVNQPPTHSTPILNSTFGLNSSTENLTGWNQSTSDPEGGSVTNIWTWKVNNLDIGVLHAPFDTYTNSTHVRERGAVREYARGVNNGSCVPNAGACPTWNSAGVVGGSYTFVTNGGSIQFNDHPDFDLANNYTVMVWIYPTVLANARIVSKQNGGAGGWELRVATANNTRLLWDSGPSYISNGNAFMINQWTLIAITNNATTSTFYVNGTAWGTQSNANPATNALNVSLGVTPDNANGDFNGRLDDVRIYNRSLSASQIRQIYLEGIQRLSNATITSGESKGGEVWQACVTPNDNSSDGVTRCSNNLTVQGVLSITGPVNATPVDRDSLNATAPDSLDLTVYADGDSNIVVSYYANVTDPVIGGQTNLLLGTAVTNSTGYAVLAFNPNRTQYAGNYNWWGAATNYVPSTNATFLVYGGLNITYRNNTFEPTTNYSHAQHVNTHVNITTAGGPETRDNMSLYSINVNSILQNTTGTVTSLTSSYTSSGQYWNSTHVASTHRGVGTWNSSVNATGKYWYTNTTTRTFTMNGFMNITTNLTSPSSSFTYQTVTTYCAVQDMHNNDVLNGINVSFYRTLGVSTTLLGYNVTNSSGNASLSYNVNVTGTYIITCNLSQQPTLFYYRGNLSERNSTLVVSGFPIAVVSPANGSAVDRDATNATTADLLVLNVSVPSYVPAGTTIEFRANLTAPSGIAGQTNIFLGSNTTIAGGYAYLVYNPASTVYAGTYSWWGANSSGSTTLAGSFVNYGSLNVTFERAFNPDPTYTKPANVMVALNFTSWGFESTTLLNTSYAPTLSALIRYPNGTLRSTLSLLFNGSAWNASQSINLTDPHQNWSVTTAGAINYFYIQNYTNRTFFVNNIAPTHGTPILNATDNPINSTTANLTAYNQSTLDTERDSVENIYNFYVNNTSIAVVRMPFAGGSNSSWTRDYSQYGTNGTVVNAVWNSSGSIGGRGAYMFNGANSYIGLPNVPSTNFTNAPLTYMAWVYLNAVGLDQKVISKRPSWAIGVYTDNQVELELFSAGTSSLTAPGNFRTIGGTALATGRWYHIAGNWNGSTMRVFVNGTLDATQIYNPASIDTTNNGVNIGKTADAAANYFNGRIDDVRIYNRTLSPEQIYEIYQEGLLNKTNAIIDQNETRAYETWSVCVTPNDNYDDGIAQCSNTVYINGVVSVISPANNTIIDRDGVNATDLDVVNLIASTEGDPNINVSFWANLTYPTGVAGQTNIFLGSNLSNTTGFAHLAFNPAGTMYAGNYTWWANATNASPQNNMNFRIFGGLNLSFTDATTNLYNETVNNTAATARYNLTSAGIETATNISSLYTAYIQSIVTNTSGSTNISNGTYVNPYWSATHNLLPLRGPGIWNVTGNTGARYFYGNTTNRSFYVYGYMNITTNSTSPSSMFTYQTTTSSCSVQNQHTNYPVNGANVSFYRTISGVPTFMGYNTTNANGNATFSYSVNTTGVYTITCNVSDQQLIYYYRGGAAERNHTLTVTGFPITPVSPANNSSVDRDSVDATDADLLVLNFSIPTYVPVGASIEFRANLSQPTGIAGQTNILLGTNTTVAGGYAYLVYNPNSSTYAGNYTWYGNSSAGAQNGTGYFVSKGGLRTEYASSTLNPNTTYFSNSTVTTSVNLTSLGPETIAELNNTYGNRVNNTFRNTSLVTSMVGLTYNGSQWTNASFVVSTLRGVGVWTTSANSSGTYWYNNSTSRTFTVYGFMNITSNSTSPTSISSYQTTTTTCGVQDQSSNYLISNVNVTFYRNGTFIGSNLTSSVGIATLSHSINSTGTYIITCNVTDQPALFYYRGVQPERNVTVTVTPFPLTPVTLANGSAIDRDATNASTVDLVVLNISVPTYIPVGTQIGFLANLTSPAGIAGQTDIVLGTNTTVAGGYAYLVFNPNSTMYAGNYTWYGNNSGGTPNGTRYVHVFGSVNVSFYNSSNFTHANYTKPVDVIVGATFASFGPENDSVINTSYPRYLNASLRRPSGVQGFARDLSYNGTMWNATATFATTEPRGYWNTVLLGGVQWFYTNTTQNRTFFVNNIAPTHTTPVLNATDNPLNTTEANLTGWNQTTSDIEGDQVTNIHTWRVNGTEYAVGHWAFNTNVSTNNSLAVRDYAGNDHNATLGNGTSSTTVPTWNGTGRTGGAYTFDGVDDVIRVGDISAIEGITSITVAAWVRTRTVGGAGSEMHIFDKSQCDGNTDTGTFELLAGVPANRALFVIYKAGGAPDYYFSGASTTSIDDANWHHVVGVYDGVNISLYIDGVRENTASAPGVVLSSNNVQVEIGGGCTGHFGGSVDYFWDGSIDDVRLYNHSLSSTQILQIYREGLWNLSNSTIVSNETHLNEVWQVCTTPNDNADDGTTLCSSSMTITGIVNPFSPANNTIVDRDSVNASVNDIISLTATAYGDPDVNISFYANLTHPTGIAGQTNIFLGSNRTDSTGYTTLYYNPNSTMYAGNYTWFVSATNASSSQTRTFLIYGGLTVANWNTSFYPSANHTENETVEVRYNLTSLGPESVAQINSSYSAAITSYFNNTTASTNTQAATFINPYWSASHTLLTLRGVGVWNASASGGAQYFFGANTLKNFTVFGYMNITTNLTTPSTVVTYQNASTSCTVQNQFTNYPVSGANVTFYRTIGGVSTFIGSNTTNANGNTSLSYNINVTGTYTITCNVTSQPSIYYLAGAQPERNNTLIVTPYPITIVSPVNNTVVDRDSVNASDPDFLTLNVSVPSYVPVGTSIEFRANLTDPAGIAGTQNILLGTNTTLAGGYAYIHYNPNSSTYAGNYTWYGNSTGGTANDTRTFISIGGLNTTYFSATLHPNSTYFQNDTVITEANITSVGLESSTELNNTYGIGANATFTSTNGSSVIAMTYNGTAWRNSTYTIMTLGTLGVWNTTAVSGGKYWYNNTTNRSFTVYGYANVTNVSVTSSPIYAYGTTTVMCGVVNGLTNAPISSYVVNITRNGTYIGTNSTNASGLTSFTFQTNTSGNYSVNCTIGDNLTQYYYALRNTYNTSLEVRPYALTPVAPANDSILDRDGVSTDPDVRLFNVSLPPGVVNGITVQVRANLTAPSGIGGQTNILLGTNTTSNGFVIVYYDPNSTIYAGNYTWWAEETEGLANGSSRYIVMGSYNQSYFSATLHPNSTYFQNDTVITEANITSNGPESTSLLNGTYSMGVNHTMYNTSGGSGTVAVIYNGSNWRNNTFNILSVGGVGVWSTNLTSGATYFYSANNTNRTTTVYGFMNITTNVTTPTSIFAYQTATTICSVQDQHTNYAVANANVTFYRNGTYLGYNVTNATGNASLVYSVNTTGEYTITCNVTNQPSIYYFAGAQPERNSTLTVVPFPVDATAPANGTIVDRDGVDAVDPDLITLNITVPSYIPNGVLLEFRANLTDPSGISGTTNVILGTNVTTTGSTLIYFNPNATMYAGNWTWYGNGTGTTVNSTRVFTVKGGLSTAYASSTLNPNSTYFQNDTVTTHVNVTSAGPETRTDLNTTYGITVLNVFTNTTGTSSTAGLTYNGSQWINNTFSILALRGVGIWNTTANSSGTYWYNNATNRTLTVYGFMNITSNSTTPASIYAYQSAVTACSVQDEHTNYTVANANVTFYRNGTFIGSNLTDSTGSASLAYSVNVTGLYTITCNVTNQPSTIYYYRGSQPERNSTLLVVPFPIGIASPANGTAVDRDETNATVDDFIMLNVTVPVLVPAGVQIEFRANLTDPAGIAGTQNILLGYNNTTAGAYAILYYNPNSTTYAGNYTWYGNSSGGGANETRNFVSYGTTNISFTSSTLNPNENYTKPANVTVSATLASYGPENNSVFDAGYNVRLNTTLIKPNGTPSYYLNLSYNGSSWNNTQQFDLNETRGYWSAQLNGVLNWFYINASASRLFYIINVPPTHTTPVLNASDNPANSTDATLTAYNQTTSDVEGDTVTNVYTWNLNGSAYELAVLPFDNNISTTTAAAVRDYAGSDTNGTLGGGAALNAPIWNATGKRGGAYTFDGSNDYISLGDINAIDGTSRLTVVAWVRINDLTKDNDIMTKGTHAATEPFLFWRDEVAANSGRTDTVSVLVYSGSSSQRVEAASNSLNDQNWHQVAFTYLGGSTTGLRLYIDGVEDPNSGTSTASVAALASNAQSVYIGADTGTANALRGSIDEVRIYNRVLTAAQIYQLYLEVNNTLNTSSIDPSITQRNDVWQACVTPNDNADDGTTLCSNSVLINGILTPIAPANDTIIDRDSASALDADSANLTVDAHGDAGVVVAYYANLTSPSIPGQTNILLGSATSNTSGYSVLAFNPNSTMYAGNYTWWPNATNATSNSTMRFTIYGSVNFSYSNALANPAANQTENESVDVRFNVTSNGPENASTLNNSYSTLVVSTVSNATGGNDTKTATLTATYWNATHRLLDQQGVGNWSSAGNATLTWFYTPANLTRNFTVYGYANITNLTIVPNPVDAYSSVAFYCTVQNQFTNAYVAGSNVSFYFNGTFIGSNTTDASGITAFSYTPSLNGLYNVSCNITSQPSIYYLAGDAPSALGLLNVTPILLTPASPANGTILDRDSVDAVTADYDTLVGRTVAGVPDNITVYFYANLTDPAGIPGQTDILLGTNVTNGSYINFTFNPNSTMYAGTYVWWMNTTGGVPNGTRTFIVKGGINLTYTDDFIHPNSTYNESDTALFHLNATSLGPESAITLNASYGTNVNLTLVSPFGVVIEKNATFNGSNWIANQSLLTYGIGAWNTSAIVNSTYFFPINYSLRNFSVIGFMNVTVFDSEEMYGGKIFANSVGHYFANVTNSTNDPMLGASCILQFYDRNNTMYYNSTSQLYENSTTFSVEGLVTYSVLCQKPFHVNATDTNNVTMRSAVDVNLMMMSSDLSAGLRNITLNITNRQNYTEHDIRVFSLIPDSLTPSFATAPAGSTRYSGEYTGNSTEWYIANITAGQSTLISFNVTGTEEIEDLFQSGLKVLSANNTVIY